MYNERCTVEYRVHSTFLHNKNQTEFVLSFSRYVTSSITFILFCAPCFVY